MATSRDPVADLRQIAFLLERDHQPTFRVKAFRNAANVVEDVGADEIAARVEAGTIGELKGIGKSTASVIVSSVRGEVPEYLARQQAVEQAPLDEATAELRRLLRGDCHTHSEWSDGGSPIREMAEAARAVGHDYLVLTDHSPSLKVANGLSPERLEEQLDVVAALNDDYAGRAASGDTHPFRILTGIEV
ncbi:PHP domain-containing protein, partial [Jatrophihabitans endophyticus]|uniref:PHP domain-containing protein n=1 Tax=Jatrophihabitans endophyticus TaxID=1206085 RepID=UPI0019E96F01